MKPNEALPNRASFPTTQWSLVVQADAEASPEKRTALEFLCQRYWFPLYAFVRRQGRAHHEAEDCTQEFLARLLAADSIGRARQTEGRFRTFLLASMRNFLTNEWHRARAAKRGRAAPHLALDFHTAEKSFGPELGDAALTPEQAYDRSWALRMLEGCLADLRTDYQKSGRGALFTGLAPLIWAHDSLETYAIPAARLGMTSTAFRVALHRLRQRLAQHLRAAVAATVAEDKEVDSELRHLIAAFSPPSR